MRKTKFDCSSKTQFICLTMIKLFVKNYIQFDLNFINIIKIVSLVGDPIKEI